MATQATAQIVEYKDEERISADSLLRAYDKLPYFSIYKDNYFTIGTTLGSPPSRHNSDVKFQLSIAQRLTKSTLPWKTYAYLFFTEKTMWNVFEPSLPMRDLNFNPGLGIGKWLISKDRVIGKAILTLEHESNGRDSIWDRSWNKLSLGVALYIDPHFMVYGKGWLAYIDSKQNKDILSYSGIYQAGFQWISSNERWVFDCTFVKRKGWNFNGNWIINAGFRLFKNHNQFLMIHYYNGYGENLLDYKQYHNRLRIGLLIRPNLFSDF
ncbi:MAG: phospholipase A [Muribaculaceae bacterium]|nr:phospholipase A [Muribaculaceae bacterium]